MKKLTCLLLPFLLLTSSQKKQKESPQPPAFFTFKFTPSETLFILNALPTSSMPSNQVQEVVTDINKQIAPQMPKDSSAQVSDTTGKKSLKH